MLIIGIICTVLGIAGIIYGNYMNSSLEMQLSSLWDYGVSDPGNIFMILGGVGIAVGLVLIFMWYSKNKKN